MSVEMQSAKCRVQSGGKDGGRNILIPRKDAERRGKWRKGADQSERWDRQAPHTIVLVFRREPVNPLVNIGVFDVFRREIRREENPQP